MTPIVTFNQFIKTFPNVKSESKELAKKILPLYSSPKLVEIVGALLTDGHIDWYTSDSRPRTRKILLYSNNKEECQWFLKNCEDLFRIGGEVQKYKPSTGYSKLSSYKAVVWNATLARILILAGVPAGDKTKIRYEVPRWIMMSNNEIKLAFLKILFNFDGSIPRNKKDRPCSWQMSYSVNKKKNLIENGVKFLGQIKKLLKEFNIKCGEVGQYKDEGDKYTLIFSFSNQESIVNFYQKIGFMKQSKQESLKTAVMEILRKGRIPLNSKKIPYLLEKLRKRFGNDRKAIDEINKYTTKLYSKRQFEHFRRGETKIPFEVLFRAIKISKNKKLVNILPKYTKCLWRLWNYRSLSPLINSSTISLATKSGN